MNVTKPGVIRGMTDADYHADPVPGGSLSSTGARRLLESPARFRYDQNNPIDSLAFQMGRAVHAKVLGVGAPVITYPDEHLTPSGKPSTRATTVAWENEQRAAGVTIISARDMALVDAMTEATLAHRGARKMLEQTAESEVSAFGIDPDTGIWVRARFDRLGDGLALDLKTTAGSASLSGFGRDAAKYGYPIQEAHYLDTLRWATGREDMPPMRFVVVEKRPPHLVAVHQFDDGTRITAAELAARARHLYAECKAADQWPGYPDETLTTAMPSWWFYQLEDEDEMEMV